MQIWLEVKNFAKIKVGKGLCKQIFCFCWSK